MSLFSRSDVLKAFKSVIAAALPDSKVVIGRLHRQHLSATPGVEIWFRQDKTEYHDGGDTFDLQVITALKYKIDTSSMDAADTQHTVASDQFEAIEQAIESADDAESGAMAGLGVVKDGDGTLSGGLDDGDDYVHIICAWNVKGDRQRGVA